jgi:hypothetical protein
MLFLTVAGLILSSITDDIWNTDDLQGEFIVKKFADPYLNKGYHITTDNFFIVLYV